MNSWGLTKGCESKGFKVVGRGSPISAFMVSIVRKLFLLKLYITGLDSF